jgi:hypothetical protein
MVNASLVNRARLIVMEDGAPATPLSWSSDGPETTIVVGPADSGELSLARRIDRRMIESEQSGQAIEEVIFVLAPRGGEGPCSARLSALLTVLRHLRSAPQVEISLVLPADAPANVRHEVFALAEVVVAELGAGPNVRIRFLSNNPERHESGFFTVPQDTSPRWPVRAALTLGSASERATRLQRLTGSS